MTGARLPSHTRGVRNQRRLDVTTSGLVSWVSRATPANPEQDTPHEPGRDG
jgi:hypothetical protein